MTGFPGGPAGGPSREIFISAGESSGDLYGSLVAREIRRRDGRVKMLGFGGRMMAQADVRVERWPLSGAIMGWTGILGKVPHLLRMLRMLRKKWRKRCPRVVLLIDNPGVNLRIARIAKSCGARVHYYVCPQVWAWGAQRLLKLRELVDQAYLILPFEEPLFQAFGIRAKFVGHPLLEVLPPLRVSRASRRARVLLLPGSREEEIRRHLPVLLAAARRLARRLAGIEFLIVATPETEKLVGGMVSGEEGLRVRMAVGANFGVRAKARIAWTASGTAVLEQGILGTPQVVFYRLNWVNWAIARAVVAVPYVSLVNLILGRRALSELLQSGFSAEALVRASRGLLRSGAARRRALRDSAELRARLKGPGASAAVARGVLEAAGAGR